MKKLFILLLAIFLFSAVDLFAQESDSAEVAVPDTISWYTNFDSAITVANNESRYILIEFYTNW